MPDLKEMTKERLTHWQRRLAIALTNTHIESERQRIQRQLAELSNARDDLDRLSADQLDRLHQHLERDPDEWIAHRLAG